jgi:hypothetical protein
MMGDYDLEIDYSKLMGLKLQGRVRLRLCPYSGMFHKGEL